MSDTNIELKKPKQSKDGVHHVANRVSQFKIVLDGEHGLENHVMEATNPSTAVSKVVRKRIYSLPLQKDVRVWVQSKHRVYEHGVKREYDNMKRTGFTNRRVRTYKPVEHAPDVPSFSFSE